MLSETPLTSEQKGYVGVFQAAGENLLDLINDILDLSKVEAGQLNLESFDFDLEELVDSTAQILAVSAHEGGLELNCHVDPDAPAALVGDPVRLGQVMTNLLSNAIKFTKNGEVTLHIGNDPNDSEPGALLFRITDTGIGIPPDKTESIFDSFTQADSSTTREYGGTGLGLTISRRLVELMGGASGWKARLGKEARFTLPPSLWSWMSRQSGRSWPGDS